MRLLVSLAVAFIPLSVLAERNAYVVEFAAGAGRSPAAIASRATLASRFRADVSNDASVVLRHEYSIVAAGVAVDADAVTIARIRQLPYVKSVHVDQRVRLLETGRLSAERRRTAPHALPTRGEGIRVAVIDTGIDYMHPALGGGFGPGFKVGGGWDFYDGDADPRDTQGHGTHVAGIIAAESQTMSGVAPGVTLIAYRVLDQDGSGLESTVVAALERAVDPNGDGDTSDRVDVVNISLGWPGTASSITARAVDAASAAGVVVCVAAGNNGGTAAITTPGTAPTAITVAAAESETAVARFSSRGPAPQSLDFKPDIAAPGVGVLSTHLNGAFVARDGTSMASPHVAGIAALLRRLHPAWTPAEVKLAIVAGAAPMNETPYARGAGFIDGDAASAAPVIADVPGIAFGIDPGTTGNFNTTRTVTVRNRGTSALNVNVASSAFTGGVVTVTPSGFTLAGGESRQLQVLLNVNNGTFPVPTDFVTGGFVQLSWPGGLLRIPWGIVRGARATITHDAPIRHLVAMSPSRLRFPVPYSEGGAEFYAAPGDTWDVLLASERDRVIRVMSREGVAVNGDEQLPFESSAASRRFVLDARDVDGTPLSELPQEANRRRHSVAVRAFVDRSVPFDDTYLFGSAREIHFGAVSPRFRYLVYESYLDAGSLRALAVEHRSLGGSGGPLTVPASTLSRGRYAWRAAANTPVSLCTQAAAPFGHRISGLAIDCVTETVQGDRTLEILASPQTAFESFARVTLTSGRVSLPPVRGTAGDLVTSHDAQPDLDAPRTAAPADAVVGGGIVHPFAFFGSTHTDAFRDVDERWGMTGSSGERHFSAIEGTKWSHHDAAGILLASGVLPALSAPMPAITLATRHRVVIKDDRLRVAGRTAVGELEMTFGENTADLAAPTFTSLRLVGSALQPIERAGRGETIALRFSVADLDYASSLSSRPIRRDSLRVQWRPHGTSLWNALTPQLIRSDEGSTATLQRIPMGDVFSAVATPATAADGYVDLRFEFEDAAGNRVIWTQSPAFVVGAETNWPKHRSVR